MKTNEQAGVTKWSSASKYIIFTGINTQNLYIGINAHVTGTDDRTRDDRATQPLDIPDICHFFTLTYFEAWKFYTQKCVNLRQNSIFHLSVQNYTHSVKLHTLCKTIKCV